MKTLLFKSVGLILIILTLSSFVSNSNETGVIVKNDKIEVVFNRTLDFNDLVKIKMDLAEKQIKLKYKSISFDIEGGLESLEFEVICNDGFSGQAKDDLIYNQTKFGFFRDYTKNAKIPFHIGKL